MKQYDLLLLGEAKTATTSLFYSLCQHEDISRSITKELMSEYLYEDFYKYLYNNPTSYFKFFQGGGKVFMDGTPSAYCRVSPLLKKICEANPIRSFKLIYIVRKPHDRIYSLLKNFIINNRITYDGVSSHTTRIFIDWIKNKWLDTLRIDGARQFTDDILFLRFDDIDFRKIFDFLNLEYREVELLHLNSTKGWEDGKFVNVKNEIEREIFHKEREEFVKMFNEDLYKVQEITNLDLKDWIE